jgi:hypothetical protein
VLVTAPFGPIPPTTATPAAVPQINSREQGGRVRDGDRRENGRGGGDNKRRMRQRRGGRSDASNFSIISAESEEGIDVRRLLERKMEGGRQGQMEITGVGIADGKGKRGTETGERNGDRGGYEVGNSDEMV